MKDPPWVTLTEVGDTESEIIGALFAINATSPLSGEHVPDTLTVISWVASVWVAMRVVQETVDPLMDFDVLSSMLHALHPDRSIRAEEQLSDQPVALTVKAFPAITLPGSLSVCWRETVTAAWATAGNNRNTKTANMIFPFTIHIPLRRTISPSSQSPVESQC